MEGVLIAGVIILCIIGVIFIASLDKNNKSHDDSIYYSGPDYTHDTGVSYRHSHSESGDWGGREGSHSHSEGDGGGGDSGGGE